MATPQTLAEFARGLGVSRAAITQAIAAGRLQKSVGKKPSGKPLITDPELALAEWKSSKDGRQNKQIGGDGGTLIDWKRRLTEEQTRAQKLANDLKESTLMERKEAERQAFEAARTIRDMILNIPDRISAELAAETSEAKIYARLTEELMIALEGTSGTIRAKTKRAS